MSRISPTRL